MSSVLLLLLLRAPLQGDEPQFANLERQLYAATTLASTVTRGIREFTQAVTAVFGQVDYTLSAITPSSKTIDSLRKIITTGAFNSIGLAHKAKTADRNSIMALSSPLISLGFGIPDINATLTIKSYRSLQKRVMSPHPGHRATLTVPLYDFLLRDGSLRQYKQEDKQYTLLHTRQIFRQMKLLRDNLFVPHIGGALPRQTLNPNPRLQERPSQCEEWTHVDSTRIRMLANITFLPAPRIGYFLTNSDSTTSPANWTGSFDIFATLFKASLIKSNANISIFIIDLQEVMTEPLHTKEDRRTARITSEGEKIEHALNQSVCVKQSLNLTRNPGDVLAKLPYPHSIQRPTSEI